MSQNVKIFRVQRGQEAEPLPFSIEFLPVDGGVSVTHDFSVFGEAPAGLTLLLASVLRFDTRGRQSVDLNGMKAFLEASMTPEDFARFLRLIEDPKLIVPMDTLGEVFEWIASVYTGRPTSPSSASSGGRRETGAMSRGTQPSGELTS